MGRIVRACSGCSDDIMAECNYGCLSAHYCKACGDESAVSLAEYMATLMPRRRKRKADYNYNQEGSK